MIGIAMYTTIETLWKRHKNKSKIARLNGMIKTLLGVTGLNYWIFFKG